MEIATQQRQGSLVVSVTGRLDAVTTVDFEKRCGALVAEGNHRVLVDFSALEYISSAGLRSLLTLAKKLHSMKGGLALCGCKGMVRDVVSLSGFDSFLPMHDDVDGALKAGS